MQRTGSDGGRKPSIRLSLAAASITLIGVALLVYGVGINLGLYRPLLRDLAVANMRLAAAEVADEAGTRFARVTGIAASERQWGERGLIDLDRLDTLVTLMAPVVGGTSGIASYAVAEENGREALVFSDDQGRRVIRLTRPDEWPGRGRFLTQAEDGRTIADEWRETVYDARQRPWFQAALAMPRADDLHWTEPFAFVSTGELGMSAVVRWTAPNGRRYAMSSDVRLQDLTVLTQRIVVGKAGMAALFTDDGRLLGLPRDAGLATAGAIRQAMLRQADDSGVAPLATAYRTWQGRGRPAGLLVPFQDTGADWFATFQPLALAGQTLWIATLAPAADFEVVGRDTVAIGAIIIVASMLVALLAALLVSRWFTRPIEQLSARIEHMDLDQPVAVTSSIQEIDGLASSLEEMRRNLAGARRELVQKAELERNIAQASKVDALGNLAGGIAHDFNNLLGAVMGFATFLVEDLPAGSSQRRYAERIVAACERGRAMVHQILAFSRRSTVEIAPVRLGDAIAEVRDMLRATLPATTQISVEINAADAVARFDKSQLIQLLVNLCVNGNDALEGKPGTLWISVAAPDRGQAALQRLPAVGVAPSPDAVQVWTDPDGTGHVATGGMPEGACICLSVSDSGTGIPPDLLGRIFEPLVTSKEKGKGTGFGLAVVHRVVTQHGGGIVVTTRAGQGTRFDILLPLDEARADIAASTAVQSAIGAPAPAAGGSAASVLVVDDDEAYLAMVATALTRAGHRVSVLDDPRAALASFRDGSARWDVMVTDQTMPHVRGTDLVQACRQSRAPTVCILCTGFSSGLNEAAALAAGADGFLIKPYGTGDLTALLERLLTQRRAAVASAG